MQQSTDRPFVLHRDADLLVVYKPPFLPTTSNGQQPCLVDWVKAQDPQAPQLHPTSRLDSPVSGLVTFARTKKANAHLLTMRTEGSYQRSYLALCQHPPTPSSGDWHWSIGLDPNNRKARRIDGLAAKAAHTHYRCLLPDSLEQTEHPSINVLKLWPRTGRTHQLRVHAAQAGSPLWGDRLYGGPLRYTAADGSVIDAPRVMLHCTQLSFPAIKEGHKELAFELPMPEDMQQFLNQVSLQG